MQLLDQTHDQFVGRVRKQYGKGTYISTPVYRQVMKQGKVFFEDLGLGGKDREMVEHLASSLDLTAGRVVHCISDDGVVKFVTRLQDNLAIESVVIPMFNRHTLCISSQVGCRMGCRFCRTGKMGLIRNLSAEEIVWQVFAARHLLGFNIRNVVFMGMGEPLDNLENVMQAIRVISDQRGLDIARRYITVSTVGLADEIDRLARIEGSPVHLSVSLNAPDDDIRSRLMPINRITPMDALMKRLAAYPLSKKAAIFIGYVLISGVNDDLEHARQLARYLSPIRAKLNLICYNPLENIDFRAPSTESYERFHEMLVAQKVFVRRRGEKGGKIMAACGQLGGKPLFTRSSPLSVNP